MLRHRLMLIAICVSSFLLANGAETLKCLVCDSSKNSNCLKDLSNVTAQNCVAEENKTKVCFTNVDTNGTVIRGCTDSDDTSVAAKCSEDSCNKHNICKTCDSSKDAQCSQTDASKDTFNAVCEAADTQCISNVKEDKHLERRCANTTDAKSCSDENTCKLCDGAICNTGIFPTNRIRCYNCELGEKCADLAKNEDITPTPCLLYKEDDQCYTFGTSETQMLRGCVSDTDSTNKCVTPNATEACKTCAISNCNNLNYMVSQTLLCIQCTSAEDSVYCPWGYLASAALNCKKQIEYYKDQECYTLQKDGAVERGCLHDRDENAVACTAENGCETCNSGNGCNRVDKADFTCKRCRSDRKSECWDKAEDIAGESCRNVVGLETKGCFWGVWNDVAIRGCLVDADERTQETCLDKNNDQCSTCDSIDCNSAKFGGAAAVAVSSAVLLSTVLLSIWHLY